MEWRLTRAMNDNQERKKPNRKNKNKLLSKIVIDASGTD